MASLLHRQNLNFPGSFESLVGVPSTGLGTGVQSGALCDSLLPRGLRAAAPALSGRPLQVLKVAILAEKYAVDYTWYVDTILNLIRIAGDYVSEEVWYRVLQIVTNRDDVQGYAAKTVFEVSTPTSPSTRVIEAEQGQLGLCVQPAQATILLLPPHSDP